MPRIQTQPLASQQQQSSTGGGGTASGSSPNLGGSSSSSSAAAAASSSSFMSSYSALSSLPPTSGHRLALRDGPALGCNYCWNSTDDHGRIQRRKTKYHCPECRTNLCIVPCYQRYHKQMEKQDESEKQIHKILTKTSSV